MACVIYQSFLQKTPPLDKLIVVRIFICVQKVCVTELAALVISPRAYLVALQRTHALLAGCTVATALAARTWSCTMLECCNACV